MDIDGYCGSWLCHKLIHVASFCDQSVGTGHPFLLEDHGCPVAPLACNPVVTSEIFRTQKHAKPFGSRSCTMDNTDGSEKLIEVLKTASHNGLIHRGELLGAVGCHSESIQIECTR